MSRTAAEIHGELAKSQSDLLEWLAVRVRNGTLVVLDSSFSSDIVDLPPLSDECFVMSADTGIMTYTIKVRSPEKQRKYAEAMLERL